MKNDKLKLTTILLAILVSVSPVFDEQNQAEGFDFAGSDEKAIEIAGAVMAAMGVRKAWDDTRFLTWKFFGNRLHVRDKHTGNIRVEGTDRRSKKSFVTLMNLHTKEGRAREEGQELSGDDLARVLRHAEGVWINDAYWLVMPYKLKDSNVMLKYLWDEGRSSGERMPGSGVNVQRGRTDPSEQVSLVCRSGDQPGRTLGLLEGQRG